MFLRKEVILATFGCVLLHFMIATNMTWTSPVLLKLTNSATNPLGRAITKDEAGWITSVMSLGCILGTQILSYLSEKIGKKASFLIAAVPCFIANVILYFAQSVELYILARFLVGLSFGTMFLFPLYVAELTHKSMREIITTLGICASCGGQLFCNALGSYISIPTLSIILAVIPAIFVTYFAIFGEEVPHYYIINNNDDLARKAIHKLRGGYEDIDETFYEIRNKYHEEKAGKLMDIFSSKPLIKGFVMVTTLLLFQHMCGNFAILFYGQNLIQNISPDLSPEISVIIFSVVMFLTSLLAPPLCSNFPKRTLLMFSGTGMFLSNTALAFYCYCDQHFSLPNSIACFPLICLTLFITMYNVGMCSLPFVILGEIFPTRVKGAATSLVCVISGMSGFLLLRYFMQMMDVLGIHGYFALCGFCCLLSVVFTKFYLIETKDKSLEQIQLELSK